MLLHSPPDPALDLVFERETELPVEKIWACWTDPGLLPRWFCPRPWTVSACSIDLRPGGRFFTRMRGPNGEDMPNEGCFLEVAAPSRLAFTSALLAGYRPSKNPFFTGVMTFTPRGSGTHYHALALHPDAEGKAQHEAMGFHDGWGKAFDQLVELARTL